MKLKDWVSEIFAELKYLEVLFGDEMSYRFEEASYMFSQITGAC